MNRKKALCAALCLILSIALGAACNQDGMSRVTINFGEIPLAKAAEKPGLLDRLLGLFLPKAYAQWTPDYGYMLLTVTSSDMDSVTAVVPPGVSSYTIEVPTGDSRLFTLFACEGGVKKWGGHVLSNVDDGELNLFMNVFPVVTNLSVTNMFPQAVTWAVRWDSVETSTGPTGYHIYRARNPLGPYEMVQDQADNHQGGQQTFNNNISGGPYYYRVSAYYPQGEGETCDPKTDN